MTSIEQTGKDIEEATQLALEQLGVTEEEVDVEILEEGSRGFLGLGQAPARVRVTVKEAKPAAPVRRVTRRRAKPLAEAAPEPAQVAEPEPVAPPQPTPEAPEDLVKQAAEISQEMLQRILESVGDGAKAVVKSTSDGQVVLEMVGGDTAILIGKHGQTINALQYLVGIATNKRLPDKVRVVLDAEGYRRRREEALSNQTLYLARKVKETGQEAVLEPLEANERRIVHLVLADDPEVYTYSEGDDPLRRVVISPRK
ncbi:MAG TPA: RNA-binding cell elongation regulator Jag/EloR [Armatimonadota bacterium]|nr:RNA-binding cell elongation regulator Jag/EloR [Armatimonadota bacterium]